MIISDMQHKLATWAGTDPTRRFDRMLRLITNEVWLTEAARITLASPGARTPGLDGMDKRRLEPVLGTHLRQLQATLLDGTYRPTPVRRVYIPKANGKQRPLGIPTLTDRIVQRAMLMAMDPIWESDFHRGSFGFRPERSVHHAICVVKMQLQDGAGTKGRWVIEGDLASYFDTVHHRLLLKCVRRRIRDRRFESLLWHMLKAGHVDRGLFCAASEGVPQGGVLSPLLSNIMLHEFDRWLEAKYLNERTRDARRKWNYGVLRRAPIAVRENRQWKPMLSYCRYADDFVVIVKGTKAQAEAIREECRLFLEQGVKLTLNVDKTHITHVNDGFMFLGHRIIRRRGSRGKMVTVTTIPEEKAQAFTRRITDALSRDYDIPTAEMVSRISRQMNGWAAFYAFTDHTARVFRRTNRAVFWKVAHWLARKYRSRIKPLMRKWYRAPMPEQAKTWVVRGLDAKGRWIEVSLDLLNKKGKPPFPPPLPRQNPYLHKDEDRATSTSGYRDVAMAMGQA